MQVYTERSSSCSRCHQSQISIFLCSEITTRLPNLMREITEIIFLTNRNFFLIIFDN